MELAVYTRRTKYEDLKHPNDKSVTTYDSYTQKREEDGADEEK
jgi:hypothetical protein